MQNTILGARGASPREVAHAERRWRMHGGNNPPPAEAAPPLMGGKARFLRLVRGRLAATHSRIKQPQQFHVESPHLQSQQQTLSAASRVEQA